VNGEQTILMRNPDASGPCVIERGPRGDGTPMDLYELRTGGYDIKAAVYALNPLRERKLKR
jgi:hypothetical protein